ncbi:MAG: redox-sensing transcriptional repressor Rex [Acidobacteriota bacterium]
MPEFSPRTLNRLSVYLRSLRHLQAQGVRRVSSRELAERYLLSATQIRKDLAQFGEFGIRGVGYNVDHLAAHLNALFGLDQFHPLVIVGMGNLGRALVRHLGFNQGSFRVVAAVDRDPAKIGLALGDFAVRDFRNLAAVVAESQARIGVLAVPTDEAQGGYDALVDAGIAAVLNFAPQRLRQRPEVPLKNVDLRVHLEELAFQIRDEGDPAEGADD